MWPGKSDVVEQVDTSKFLTKAEFDAWTADEAMIDDLRLLCNEAINIRLAKLEQQMKKVDELGKSLTERFEHFGNLLDQIHEKIAVE